MFEIGTRYNRRNEIHAVYGGQQQGGMSTPSAHPIILLFTGDSGAAHGYKDEARPDGTYWYTGEGQTGDQTFVRANAALRDHRAAGKRAFLFEDAKRGMVDFQGEVEYLGHHFEQRPDGNSLPRQVIVFELGFCSHAQTSVDDSPDRSVSDSDIRKFNRKSLAELRELALRGAAAEATTEQRKQVVRVRSAAVREYVLKRAAGSCEGCQNAAPFLTTKGTPYLEPHHTTRIADGGPDHPEHVIALCPTCHRRVHYGQNGRDYNETLKALLPSIEAGTTTAME